MLFVLWTISLIKIIPQLCFPVTKGAVKPPPVIDFYQIPESILRITLELDPYALRELVKAIYVDAPVKVNGKRTQHIPIQYEGIGFIPLDELLKEETA